jgi:hypothetical protein
MRPRVRRGRFISARKGDGQWRQTRKPGARNTALLPLIFLDPQDIAVFYFASIPAVVSDSRSLAPGSLVPSLPRSLPFECPETVQHALQSCALSSSIHRTSPFFISRGIGPVQLRQAPSQSGCRALSGGRRYGRRSRALRQHKTAAKCPCACRRRRGRNAPRRCMSSR